MSSREDEGQVQVNNINSNDEPSITVTVEASTRAEESIRPPACKPLSHSKLSLSTDSNVSVMLVDTHSKPSLCGNMAQISKNKPMAIKVVGKTDLSTQDLVAKAKKMLTFLSRSKAAKKSIVQNCQPIKKVMTSTPIKQSQLSNPRSQHLKEDVMKELIASTPSGFSVTRTYSGLRDKVKESKNDDATSSMSTIYPKAIKPNAAPLPNSSSFTVAKSFPSFTSTCLVECIDDNSAIELSDDGVKRLNTSDVPNASESPHDLLSKNCCAISICKHMSGECNLASRTSESPDGREWYNFLRVADPAHYTAPTCPMKQIFLCFCHFSPEYIVYAPRLRSHSIPTISLTRHLNQDSAPKDKGDCLKDEKLIEKKLADAEAKVRQLEYKVKNMNSILSKFSQDELRKIQGRAVKWSTSTLEKALSVRARVGPSAYVHISKLFPMPSLRVLNKLSDEFLKELNVDRSAFPSKNKSRSKDRRKASQEKQAGHVTRRKTGGAIKKATSSQAASTAPQNELNQAIATIDSQAVSATCSTSQTHLDEFASHAILDISHMYPSNPSVSSLSLSSVTPEMSSLQMSQTFSEIDFSSFNSSSTLFTSPAIPIPQATSVQRINVTNVPSSSAACTETTAILCGGSGGDKLNSSGKCITLVTVASDKGTQSKSNASVTVQPSPSTITQSRKRKSAITPKSARNGPKTARDTNHTDTNLPASGMTSSSAKSQRKNTSSNRAKNNPVSKSTPRASAACKNARSHKPTASSTHANDCTLENESEVAAKKSKQEIAVKFDLVDTANLSSKERITVFNLLTEIHVKFKAQYNRCSSCCLFLHGDALNQFMRMVETNVVKYSHLLSDLASTFVKAFQEEMVQFVTKLKLDIFPKCPLSNEHLRFLIVEYITASINCKRSKMAPTLGGTASTAPTSANQVSSLSSKAINRGTSKGQSTTKSLPPIPPSLPSDDLTNTHAATAQDGKSDAASADITHRNEDKEHSSSANQPRDHPASSSSVSATVTLVK